MWPAHGAGCPWHVPARVSQPCSVPLSDIRSTTYIDDAASVPDAGRSALASAVADGGRRRRRGWQSHLEAVAHLRAGHVPRPCAFGGSRPVSGAQANSAAPSAAATNTATTASSRARNATKWASCRRSAWPAPARWGALGPDLVASRIVLGVALLTMTHCHHIDCHHGANPSTAMVRGMVGGGLWSGAHHQVRVPALETEEIRQPHPVPDAHHGGCRQGRRPGRVRRATGRSGRAAHGT